MNKSILMLALIGLVLSFSACKKDWEDPNDPIDDPIADGCVDSSKISPFICCFAVYDPVCGCNGVTYGNDCEAEFMGGVTSWTKGPCNGSKPPKNDCVDPSKINFEIYCTQQWAPVCGCNGVTYNNSCQAEYKGGVTRWKPGPCKDKPYKSVTVCKGQCVTLSQPLLTQDAPRRNFSWTPTTGVDCATCASTKVCPEENTTYTLTITEMDHGGNDSIIRFCGTGMPYRMYQYQYEVVVEDCDIR